MQGSYHMFSRSVEHRYGTLVVGLVKKPISASSLLHRPSPVNKVTYLPMSCSSS